MRIGSLLTIFVISRSLTRVFITSRINRRLSRWEGSASRSRSFFSKETFGNPTRDSKSSLLGTSRISSRISRAFPILPSDKEGLEPAEAHLLASLSEGSIGKALEIRDEIREVPRRELFESLVGLPKVSFEKRERGLEALPSQRESLLLILEVMKTLVRDLLITKIVRRDPVLIHGDLRSPMEKLAPTWTIPALLKRIETLHRTALAVRSNANTTLALEAMMLSWAEG